VDPNQSASVPDGPLAPGPIDKDSPHGLGRGSKKVPSVLPIGLLVTPEAYPGIVDQCGGLQGLARGFPRHPGRCQSAQLIVDNGDQPMSCRRIAAFDLPEDLGHIATQRILCYHPHRLVNSRIDDVDERFS
jgi:hypothetical protein